jgi:hypothetical protein
MVTKPNILIGLKRNGEMEAIAISDDADIIKQAFDKERDNPSGKYIQIQEYRRPPFRRRRDISQSLPSSEKKTAPKTK